MSDGGDFGISKQTKKSGAAIICPVHQPKPKYKYIQPPRTESCAPKNQGIQSKYPLEGHTVYHLSYPGVDPATAKQCRPASMSGTGNIKVPDDPLENRTVTNQSFVYTPQKPAEPCMPRSRHLLGAGPLQSVTTQRHDYTPKPRDRTQIIVPTQHIHPIQAKMAGSTITMESFLPVGEVEPTRSCKPDKSYQVPTVPIDGNTVQQLSYIKPELPKKETPPWAMKGQYQQPQFRMEDNTIYNGSYSAPGVFQLISSPSLPCMGTKCLCMTTATEDLN